MYVLVEGVYVHVCLSNVRIFANFYLCTSTFRQNTKHSDTGSPAGHIGRGLCAIRALWSAWRALEGFFPAGVEKTNSLVSIREALFCTRDVRIGNMLSVFSPRLSWTESTQLRHRPGIQQTTRIPSFQRCRPHHMRVRHTHMRNTAVAGCVCRSLPSVLDFFFIRRTCTQTEDG